MGNAVVRLSGTGLAVFLAIAPLSAHHVPAAKFDPAKPVTLTGRVTKVEWLNPHVHVFIDAQDTNPKENWAIELESTIDLKRSGWSRDTLKVGDAITVQAIAARDGSTTAWANSVIVTGTGQRVFTVTPAQPPAVQAGQPTPRWPDGQPRLGPPAGQIMGYWAFPSATMLVEQGVSVQADAHGMLRNLGTSRKTTRCSSSARRSRARGAFSFRMECSFWKSGTMAGSGSCLAPGIRTGISFTRTAVRCQRFPRNKRTIRCTGAGRSASGTGIPWSLIRRALTTPSGFPMAACPIPSSCI
jgi:hypothetical protein